MEIKQALELMGIKTLEEIEQESIKKKWKKAMKMVHPDIGGDTKTAAKYNVAYEMLMEYAEKMQQYKQIIEKSKVEVCLIELSDLIEIYNGKVVVIAVNNSKDKAGSRLSRENLYEKRVIVDIPIEVRFNGITSYHECTVIQNQKDDYQIEIFIDDADIFASADINIKLYNREIKSCMRHSRMIFAFKLEHGINVAVQIERVVNNGQKDS